MQGHYGKETFPSINLLLNPFSVIPFFIYVRWFVQDRCIALVFFLGDL